MNKRLFFECAYDGTAYSGWQKQPNAETIQETIESCLAKLFPKNEIETIGCGRTDAGVHAKQSFFHIDLPLIYSFDQLQYKLNNMLPSDIVIANIHEVQPESHARFDAKKRSYEYFLHHKKLPFHFKYSLFFPRHLDVDKMNKGALYLIGKHDFTSFSKLHTDVNNNFCEVYTAAWKKVGDQLCFEISANRFLRNMVRAIVGTLLEVGLGNIPPEQVKKIMQLKDRQEAGFSVPAKGLFLKSVEYDYL